MFYIRVDANTEIGAGHVMRCLSIAEALKEIGEVIIFMVADEESAALIKKRGFAYLSLNSKWNDLEYELEMLVTLIKENQITSLLVDSYYATEAYLKALQEQVELYYLDDLGDNIFPVDTLINYNIYAAELNYENSYQKKVMKVPRLLLGCDYVPIRRDFLSVEYSVQKNVKHILVSTGGSDSRNIAGKILERIQNSAEPVLKNLHIHVISGAYNPHSELLKRLAKTNPMFHIYENVTKMAELMQKCDVAIAAYGSTIYELAVLGVPTIGFYFVDNQRKIAEAFGREYTQNAGNIAEQEEEVLDSILIQLQQLACFYQKRSHMNIKMKELLDGAGAKRLAEIMKQHQKENKRMET